MTSTALVPIGAAHDALGPDDPVHPPALAAGAAGRDDSRDPGGQTDGVTVALRGLIAGLAETPVGRDDAARIDRIRAMEELKGALSGAQIRETVAFKHSQLADQRAAGVSRRRLGSGIAGQVGLARRESPHRASGLIGLAEAIDSDLPGVLAALVAGELSEWRAMIVVREICCLDRDQRRAADAELALHLSKWSDRQLTREARRIAYRLDPHAYLARSSRAAKDRRVSIRPAPDTMTWVSALLPVKQGVAVFAALTRAADAARATGDERSRGQVMADTLLERVIGTADPDRIPINVTLVMSDRALLGGDDEPAQVDGHGPIPAPLARRWVRNLPDTTRCWLRRLYTDPATGLVQSIDGRPRFFTGALRRAIVTRDQLCRTPWCGAPIRHLDHAVRHGDGGATSEQNSQGLCEACNQAKEAPGWSARPDPGGAGTAVHLTTPTGHAYTSTPPALPGHRVRRDPLPAS